MKYCSLFSLHFFSKQHFSSTVGLNQLPTFWKKYENETLYNRQKNYLEYYEVVKHEVYEQRPTRSAWSVMYASGMSKIGKTAFGLNLPSKLLEISIKINDEHITKILDDPVYLLIDANGGGDGYAEEDMYMHEYSCLGWRLLARACGMTAGVRELRTIIKDKTLSDYIEINLKQCQQLSKLLLKIDNLKKNIWSVDVISALANDYRYIKGLKQDANVTIFVHHDEHQLIFEQRKNKKNLTYDNAIKDHKEYLYDLCTLRGNGTETWCRNNHITLLPIFTGTSGIVLRDLMEPTHFTKKHIFLGILDNADSFKLLENQFNSFGIRIHDDWKKNKNNECEYLLSPLDVILSELGGIPGLIKNSFPYLKETLSKNIQNRQSSILQANQILQKELTPVITTDKSLLSTLTFLTLTGITIDVDLTVDDNITLSKSEIHGLHLFVPTTDMARHQIYVPPCYLLSMHQKLRDNDRNLVKYYEKFLNLESIFQKQTDHSELFEKLNANRILLYLYTFQNILKASKCCIHQLFPTRVQNKKFKDIEIDIDLETSNKIDHQFIIQLDVDEHMFKIDKHTKPFSCLTKDHRTVEANNYGIYLLPKNHPRFDIFLKLPCTKNSKVNEIHIFVQTKTSQDKFKESSSCIETSYEKFIEALDCHDVNYKKLTNRRILTCMVVIDSRFVKDDEHVQSLLTQDKYPCKIITSDELALWFPNFSHRFLIKNYKDTIKI